MSYVRMGFRPSLTRAYRRRKRSELPPPAGTTDEAVDYPHVQPPTSELSSAQLLAELLASPPLEVTRGLMGRAFNAQPTPGDELAGLPAEVRAAASRRLLVAREILQRQLLQQMQGRRLLDCPESFGEWLKLHCAVLDYEVFLVVYLDCHLRLIAIEQLFRGSVSSISIHPREVLKGALAHHAAALAFAHNHPSGKAEPSKADRDITAQLKAALQLIDVRVIEHFIVAGGNLFSFSQNSLL